MKKTVFVFLLSIISFNLFAEESSAKNYDVCRSIYSVIPEEEHPLHPGDCYFYPLTPAGYTTQSQYYIPTYYGAKQDTPKTSVISLSSGGYYTAADIIGSSGLRYTHYVDGGIFGIITDVSALFSMFEDPSFYSEGCTYTSEELYFAGMDAAIGVTLAKSVIFKQLRLYGEALVTGTWYENGIAQSGPESFHVGARFGTGVELLWDNGVYLRTGPNYQVPLYDSVSVNWDDRREWGFDFQIGYAW